jgi:hypothetical protein
MNKRTALASALLAIAFASQAFGYAQQSTPSDPKLAARADEQVEKIATNLAKYIGEIDRAIAMAKDGQYGKLQRGSEARLSNARQTIGDLLHDVSDPRQLSPDQRIELFNAHQEIASIINHQDKSRVVCTRERKTGSRLSTTECMTVGEREERARIASLGTQSMQQNVCTPGEGNACTRF